MGPKITAPARCPDCGKVYQDPDRSEFHSIACRCGTTFEM